MGKTVLFLQHVQIEKKNMINLQAQITKKKFKYLSVRPMESASEYENCCPLFGTQNTIQVSLSFEETVYQCHIMSAGRTP